MLSARIWADLTAALGIYTISSRLARRAMCFALAAAGCASLPKGRYAIDDVAIEGQSELDVVGDRGQDCDRGEPTLLWGCPREWSSIRAVRSLRPGARFTRVERIYRAHGYYEAHARAGRVEKASDGHVKVTIVVEEGPVVLVGDVKLEGIRRSLD